VDTLQAITAHGQRSSRLTHLEHIPEQEARVGYWPDWADAQVRHAYERAGIPAPWRHQTDAAEHAWAGQSVALATGTASGKSLAFQLPALSAARPAPGQGAKDTGTTLYLAPTKALAADQVRALDALGVPDVVVVPYDGDTPRELREVARSHGQYLLSNPDMLHRAMLPNHHRWSRFLRALRFVVVDEVHAYRGLFGSHVAQVLRRLRRVCARYDASPTFVLASATSADPVTTGRRLTGADMVAVTDDASPRGATNVALWEPPPHPVDPQARRNALAETADLLTDLVVAGSHTVAFVRSRRAAEVVAGSARDALGEIAPELTEQVAAYRAGFLPDERRRVEQELQSGRLTGVAATTALELGVDISGLDSVLLAGWPGTRASFWQQVGRAGRAGRESVAVLIARDDPLDSYVVHHPETVFGTPVETTVLDPDNPHVLGPHLCAAAAEHPLGQDELEFFGPNAAGVVSRLSDRGSLRRRRDAWYWVGKDSAADLADIRGGSGRPVGLVESGTGRLLGTVDPARAHGTAHPGAIYVHQGETYLVDELDLDEDVAMLRPVEVDYTTSARSVSDLRVLEVHAERRSGPASVSFGAVEVTSKVVSFLRRRADTGEVLGETSLELPEQRLRTKSVWWTLDDDAVLAAGVEGADAPGAAHAAEHAAIGLLPLVATCDRWDIGGLSTARHPDTGALTVFVHDAQPGGAGFAEQGHSAAGPWWHATREAIAQCRCALGCPSCVQSPKCGNGNDPLDKLGAVALLDALLSSGVGSTPR